MAKIHFIADLWFTQGLLVRFLFIVNLLQNAFLEKLFVSGKKKHLFTKEPQFFKEASEHGAIYWCFLASFARD